MVLSIWMTANFEKKKKRNMLFDFYLAWWRVSMMFAYIIIVETSMLLLYRYLLRMYRVRVILHEHARSINAFCVVCMYSIFFFKNYVLISVLFKSYSKSSNLNLRIGCNLLLLLWHFLLYSNHSILRIWFLFHFSE